MIRIGLVGCGTIGRALTHAITKKYHRIAKIAFLCDRHHEAAERLKRDLRLRADILPLSSLIRKSDFIVEAASQQAVLEMLPILTQQKKNAMILSVGALLRVPPRLLKKAKGLLYIPSGAVSGIDGILAAKTSAIRHVSIRTYKPLKGIQSAPYFKHKQAWLKRIQKPTVVFRGTAKQAIKHFPQNVNVAATLSLAGIGSERTKVTIITSPAFRRNSHEVLIEGDFGMIQTRTDNVPSKLNPKTSALAFHSAIACFDKMISSIKIGT
ncbi:MAG: aspartate dehydrogenase [Candidatus Omnitrophica bacterium CG11_big_fil_rev_8_21_14_0_20_45_26]|uniref:L-aspartate dehydrogenase n=1 Tax=Candidatus Abzuiibacterium crystallinum TaxID=1974748 RepID=A0A2H0LN02_9BACT|nr:MAG: aspartate dehydrogenase [Candidatus Omnitrophica bacterium CG11_big_fil_rev_8_21_14_0_20_45_26]PIW65232.1 MAG: aspartate dehydrogenase [Candidatus Omnitrophica bacterium CG12_big_fil_rev_8_21_14_0_65_45_16]